MYDESTIMTEEKLTKLAKCLQKHYRVDEQEALEIIYEEWDLIENAFSSNIKVKDICNKLLNELNEIYSVA